MNDLTGLDEQIRQRLAAADEAREHCRKRVEQHQVELERRYEEFGKTADRLLGTIIRPRLARLAAHFDNAELLPPEQSSRYHATCRFRHTDRFPATATLVLSASHDAHVEHLVASYHLEILPVFFQFEGRDEKAFPLAEVKEAELAAWVETKLLQFVDTYLGLEMADAYQQDSLVTDPVCGSRITRTCAATQEERAGRRFFFCSETCHHKFTASPDRYASLSRR